LWGVLPIKQGEFCAPVTEVKSNSAAYRGDDLTMAMASAHSLTIIDHRLSGDPLDLKVQTRLCSKIKKIHDQKFTQMFESTGWILEEPAIDDSSKYDSMCPTVVQPPRPDLLMSAQHAEVEVKI